MSQSHSNMEQGCGNFELDPNFNFIIVGKGVEIMGNQYNQCLNNLRIAHCQSQSASVSNLCWYFFKSNKSVTLTMDLRFFNAILGIFWEYKMIDKIFRIKLDNASTNDVWIWISHWRKVLYFLTLDVFVQLYLNHFYLNYRVMFTISVIFSQHDMMYCLHMDVKKKNYKKIIKILAKYSTFVCLCCSFRRWV